MPYIEPPDTEKKLRPYDDPDEEQRYQQAKQHTLKTGKPIWRQGKGVMDIMGRWADRFEAEQDRALSQGNQRPKEGSKFSGR